MQSFAELWPGQEQLASAMEAYDWLFALKAGKLGFTELECAFDAWRALFAHPNARVHLFSRDQLASRDILRYVKFGLFRLPPFMRIKRVEEAGGDTLRSFAFRGAWMDGGDVRTIISYPATGTAAIDQSCAHSHVDELSHMATGGALWNSVITTVEPGGTCHVVTRGAGDAEFSAELWQAAMATPADLRGRAPHLYPLFVGFDQRPGRDDAYRRDLEESGSYSTLGLSYFLPRTPEEALAGDEDSPYIPLDRWDQLAHELPPLAPGDRTPIVLALDGAVTSDCFAAVGVCRHPDRKADVAIRICRVWRPADFPDGRIDFHAVEEWVRMLAKGGCREGHPRPLPSERVRDCRYCQRGFGTYPTEDESLDWELRPLNVAQITFDPYQLEDMYQRLSKAKVAHLDAFDQGGERLIGDALMYTMAMQGTLTHNGDPTLREHIGNARAQVAKNEDTKMRIVKKAPARKIDAAVAAAMAVKRCRDLPLGSGGPRLRYLP